MNMARTLGVLVCLVLLAAGCGSTAKMVKILDNVPTQERRFEIGSITYDVKPASSEFADRFRKNLEKELQSQGIMSAGQAKYRVDIKVQELRVRGMSRVMGVLAGKDRIKSLVTVTNLGNREMAAQGELESHSIRPIDDMAAMHPAAIAKLLAGAQ